ncbi:MAG: O-antigen ligase family protein [Solirubrobacteraceae bacterium]
MLRRTVVRLWRIEPAWPISLGLVASSFSGHWARLGIPGPLDRALLLGGLVLAFLRAGSSPDLPPIRWRRLHLLLATVIFFAIVSAFWVGSIDVSSARFGIVDRLGLIPFVAFIAAPTVFHTAHQRRILLGVLVVFGAYLGFTAVAEAVNANALVWPRYILDQSVGIHFGRSRGPFVEAASNGLGLILCGTAAAVALGVWRDRAARSAAWAIIGLCAAGALLTYTRQVWLGAGMGAIAAMAVFPPLRWRLIPTTAVAVAGLAIALTLLPGLQEDLSDRLSEAKPAWARRNTNAAAVLMITEKPALGWGWGSFRTYGSDHFRTLVDIPYRGQTQEVHNVFLARFVDLGLIGGGLWLIAVFLAVGGALRHAFHDDLEIWRRGFVVIVVGCLAGAMLAPFTSVIGPLALWLWAGLLTRDRGAELA